MMIETETLRLLMTDSIFSKSSGRLTLWAKCPAPYRITAEGFQPTPFIKEIGLRGTPLLV